MPWTARSPSDPNPDGMKFDDEMSAGGHCIVMNQMLECYDENKEGFWNKDYWKTKPEPWVYKKED